MTEEIKKDESGSVIDKVKKAIKPKVKAKKVIDNLTEVFVCAKGTSANQLFKIDGKEKPLLSGQATKLDLSALDNINPEFVKGFTTFVKRNKAKLDKLGLRLALISSHNGTLGLSKSGSDTWKGACAFHGVFGGKRQVMLNNSGMVRNWYGMALDVKVDGFTSVLKKSSYGFFSFDNASTLDKALTVIFIGKEGK